MADARELRGIEIASYARIVKHRNGWRVPSESGDRRDYFVRIDREQPFCSCPDFQRRGGPCKHIHATRIHVRREETREEVHPDGTIVRETRSVEVTYTQDWPAYNAAQTREKDHFQALLHALCRDLRRPETSRRGRPRIPLSDAIFAATFKVYSGLSGRRFMSDLRAAHERGYVGRVPCYNSIFNVMDAAETAGVLDFLIGESARPLKSLESHFACDSTGFSSSRFDRWIDHKFGRRRIKRRWVKAHVMCGAKTNVVTALEIHGPDANDAPLLPSLLSATSERFDVREVSADLGYTSIANLEAIEAVGARPYIPFKRNTVAGRGGVWDRLFHYFCLNREEFEGRYHLRSNVETTFHMIKAKFGDSVRSKTDRTMANEVRAKVLCHNICCVIQSAYEFGVDVPVLSQAA